MATRKENAEKLEAMATKGPRLSGLKNMRTGSKIALVGFGTMAVTKRPARPPKKNA